MSTFSEGQPISIKELLIEATFAPNRALRSGVEVVDLGELGKESERVYDKSISEETEDRVECLMPAIITRDKKLELYGEEIGRSHLKVGSMLNIGLDLNFYRLPKEQRQEFYVATGIRNYPMPQWPFPPYPVDFGPLFFADTNPLAETAVFVSSPEKKIVVFRGETTPNWTETFTREKIISWEKMLDERSGRHIKANMSDDEKYQYNLRIKAAFLRDLAAKYDLQAFSCPLRENIARRMEFPQR